MQASSSIGRAPVSKTGGWGFDSLLACQMRPAQLDRSMPMVGVAGEDAMKGPVSS